MSTDTIPTALDGTLLCYCTDLTFGALREACREGRWPLPGKERTGKLCTGCLGDLLVCLRAFGGRDVR
ncbi:MAG TPA: hypothetical protein VLK35_21070 [Methylomirabilota bacterium]|nr:hypothetical protein [Methylomirabilota bacterium]